MTTNKTSNSKVHIYAYTYTCISMEYERGCKGREIKDDSKTETYTFLRDNIKYYI